jgi:transposase-like protein
VSFSKKKPVETDPCRRAFDRLQLCGRRLLAAAVKLTVVAGENLTVGSTVWLPAESMAPAGDSFHQASLRRAEARCSEETRMLLRHYLEHGTSKSALARQLGVSRDTIHRWIREGDLDRDLDDEAVRYGPRPLGPTKLDPYKPIIEARLATYPELSAVRLLEEIRAAGYPGGYSQLKAFVQRVRPPSVPEPVIRFETPAGRQAQVDFARFRFAWGVRYGCSSCSATRGCSGVGSTRARTWPR